jgi:hypothetical protein
MSRRPTRQLTLEFVLRTLTRLRMMTRLDTELLAKELLPHRRDVQFLAEYLDDVAEYMMRLGVDPNKHPNGNCAQCGDEIGSNHNGARYCSNRCRQRAYRLRMKRRRRAMKHNKAAIRDTSYAAENKSTVTHSAT